jgi:DNA-binding MarR family transcriptional regulator
MMTNRQDIVNMEEPDMLGLLIADIYESAGLLRRSGEELAGAEGQTQARWQVLSVVSDQALSVPQAARRLGLTRQGVQRVANDLVDAGLLDFATNPDHKSSPLLAITPAGRKAFNRITARATQFHQELELPLSDRDLATARRVLQVLNERLVAAAG